MSVVTSAAHTFGTDSFLLADFAAPKARETACDLGSGCGIIPLLWLRGGTGPKHVAAIDIQEHAIAQMTESVRISQLQDRMSPVLADLRNLKGVAELGTYGLVTCNPPYKAADTGILSRAESDRIARHETLCTIGDCCRAAARLLRYGGRFCVCQLPERLVDTLAAMRTHKIEPKRIRFVQKNKDSAPWLFLVEGKSGSKPFLQAEPALTLYENGATSAEMRRIYGQYGEIIDLK